MTTKLDYTEEEWKTLITTPYLTAMLIILSDFNLTFYNEVAALAQGVMASVTGSKVPLIVALATDVMNKENQEKMRVEMEGMKGEKDVMVFKKQMLDQVLQAVSLVDEKSVEDGQAIRKWLLFLAQQTAEGSKEGGFLGIGAVRVSALEQAELDNLKKLLGEGLPG
jgi:hypothetical protein